MLNTTIQIRLTSTSTVSEGVLSALYFIFQCIFTPPPTAVGILKSSSEEIRTRESNEVKQAFQSYMAIVSSPPSGFEKFALQVNKYLQQPPFEFTNPVHSDFNALRRVSRVLEVQRWGTR